MESGPDQTRNNNRILEEERKRKIDHLKNMQLEVDQLTTSFKPEEERKLHDRVRELQDMIARAEREVDEISSRLISRLDLCTRTLTETSTKIVCKVYVSTSWKQSTSGLPSLWKLLQVESCIRLWWKMKKTAKDISSSGA
ncbi:hypothetical protein PsorP6_010822 [Peronosclerospora sorghi]|uniref:Uncharacterized protein n=1 Tax=Peronosclerospora sorghi TaxID=230839 RepID=A0ACC0VUN1_9STRA|nr:hypothetical protein PsorP6_010822 [Peronosclerospora sorghi]